MERRKVSFARGFVCGLVLDLLQYDLGQGRGVQSIVKQAATVLADSFHQPDIRFRTDRDTRDGDFHFILHDAHEID